jgi:hypothetical protein
MSEKCKSASHSAIQVKNQRQSVGIGEKLRMIMQCEKGERIDVCCNVRLTHGVIHKICDNADRIKESAAGRIKEGFKSGNNEFV